MTESIRQRKKFDESKEQSAVNDDTDRGIAIDRDDHQLRSKPLIPVS